MKVRAATIFFILASTDVQAQTCPSFGFEAGYLSDYFCGAFADVAGPSTRTIGEGRDAAPLQDGLPKPDPEWLALPQVENAWRSDPAKTIQLIERIRAAGGRAVK